MAESIGSTIIRTFAASSDAVFDAWVAPAPFSTWWGGSDIEIPLDSLSMDVRPGGDWKATLILGNGVPDFHFRGEYIEVDRPNRLVFTMTDEPGDARELITVIVTAVQGGTEMRFTQTGGNLSPEEYDGVTTAWQIAFDVLDTLLDG